MDDKISFFNTDSFDFEDDDFFYGINLELYRAQKKNQDAKDESRLNSLSSSPKVNDLFKSNLNVLLHKSSLDNNSLNDVVQNFNFKEKYNELTQASLSNPFDSASSSFSPSNHSINRSEQISNLIDESNNKSIDDNLKQNRPAFSELQQSTTPSIFNNLVLNFNSSIDLPLKRKKEAFDSTVQTGHQINNETQTKRLNSGHSTRPSTSYSPDWQTFNKINKFQKLNNQSTPTLNNLFKKTTNESSTPTLNNLFNKTSNESRTPHSSDNNLFKKTSNESRTPHLSVNNLFKKTSNESRTPHLSDNNLFKKTSNESRTPHSSDNNLFKKTTNESSTPTLNNLFKKTSNESRTPHSSDNFSSDSKSLNRLKNELIELNLNQIIDLQIKRSDLIKWMKQDKQLDKYAPIIVGSFLKLIMKTIYGSKNYFITVNSLDLIEGEFYKIQDFDNKLTNKYIKVRYPDSSVKNIDLNSISNRKFTEDDLDLFKTIYTQPSLTKDEFEFKKLQIQNALKENDDKLHGPEKSKIETISIASSSIHSGDSNLKNTSKDITFYHQDKSILEQDSSDGEIFSSDEEEMKEEMKERMKEEMNEEMKEGMKEEKKPCLEKKPIKQPIPFNELIELSKLPPKNLIKTKPVIEKTSKQSRLELAHQLSNKLKSKPNKIKSKQFIDSSSDSETVKEECPNKSKDQQNKEQIKLSTDSKLPTIKKSSKQEASPIKNQEELSYASEIKQLEDRILELKKLDQKNQEANMKVKEDQDIKMKKEKDREAKLKKEKDREAKMKKEKEDQEIKMNKLKDREAKMKKLKEREAKIKKVKDQVAKMKKEKEDREAKMKKEKEDREAKMKKEKEDQEIKMNKLRDREAKMKKEKEDREAKIKKVKDQVAKMKKVKEDRISVKKNKNKSADKLEQTKQGALPSKRKPGRPFKNRTEISKDSHQTKEISRYKRIYESDDSSIKSVSSLQINLSSQNADNEDQVNTPSSNTEQIKIETSKEPEDVNAKENLETMKKRSSARLSKDSESCLRRKSSRINKNLTENQDTLKLRLNLARINFNQREVHSGEKQLTKIFELIFSRGEFSFIEPLVPTDLAKMEDKGISVCEKDLKLLTSQSKSFANKK